MQTWLEITNVFMPVIVITLVVLFVHDKKTKQTIVENYLKTIPHGNHTEGDLSALWTELNEMRSILNKTLVGVNKQLRAHGRTLQVQGITDTAPKRTKSVGLIVPQSNGKNSFESAGQE